MARTYDQMMDEIRTSWGEPERALSESARRQLARVRLSAFELGPTLRERRRKLGLSQKDVAALTGIAQAEICRIERDKGNPTWSTIRKLASVLELDIRVENSRV